MKSKLVFLLLPIALPTSAQITTDGTIGQALNLPGPDYQIGADLGQQHGGNLFHSFQDFNLQSVETATFSGPNHIQNVISRVTGGHSSNIDGIIRLTIPNADFYFLNPYGIMFGPNARLDVQGSFHASTADYLRLSQGGRFDARNPSDSVLTVAPIESFGFLTNSPAPLSVEGSQLEISNDQTFSFISGDLSIKNAQVIAPMGKINLVSVAKMTDVIPQLEDFVVPSLRSEMTISEQSLIDVSGEGGGRIFIRGGQFVIDNSTIAANTLENKNGQQINVLANNITLLGSAKITGDTLGQGRGSDIHINAIEQIMVQGISPIEIPIEQSPNAETQVTSIKDLSGFFSRSGIDDSDKGKALGDAGQINLQAKQIKFKRASIASTSTYSAGKGGNINIKTENLQMHGIPNSQLPDANFTASTVSQGQGGKITIVAKVISLTDEVTIESIASDHGNAGQIEVQAQSLTLVNNSKIRTNTVGRGHGGNVLIQAQEIKLIDGSMIGSTTISAGHGGDVQIKVAGKLLIIGQGKTEEQLNARIAANTLGRQFIKGWTLTEPTELTGKGGKVLIEAGELELKEGGQIQTFSNNVSHSSGPAGNIIVQVQGTLLIHGFRPEANSSKFPFNSGIYSSSSASDKQAGPAGDITLYANQLVMQNGGIINSDTNNSSKGGNLNIQVSQLDIDGKVTNPDLPTSGLYASSSSPKIDAGMAGNIIIEADTIHLSNDGKMTTSAQNAGGGNITLHNSGMLYLHNGTMTASVHGGTGDGGNITIENPQFIVLNKAQIKAQANAGNGGNIYVAAQHFVKSDESLVSASSRLGLDGHVEIDSPTENVTEGMLTLSSEMVDASHMMEKTCEARSVEAYENRNHFKVNPIAGSPTSPFDLQPSRLSQSPIKINPTYQQPNQNLMTHHPHQLRLSMTCQPASIDPLETSAVIEPEKVIPEQLF